MQVQREVGTFLPQEHPDAQRVCSIGRKLVSVAVGGTGGGHSEHLAVSLVLLNLTFMACSLSNGR